MTDQPQSSVLLAGTMSERSAVHPTAIWRRVPSDSVLRHGPAHGVILGVIMGAAAWAVIVMLMIV